MNLKTHLLKGVFWFLALLLGSWEPIIAQGITGSATVCAGSIETYSVSPIIPPPNWQSTIAETFSWSITNGDCTASGTNNCSFPDISGTSIDVEWDNSCVSGTVTAEVFLEYIDQNGFVNIISSINNLTVDVNKPTSFSIGGPPSVECQSTAPRTYTATGSNCLDNATFNWNVGNGWAITSGQGTSSVTVIPNLTDATSISVTATCGSHSANSNKAVNRDCPTNVYHTDLPTIQPHTVADILVQVENTTGSFTSIANGNVARIKSGDKILIKPNFKVEHGGEFYAKIGPCIDCSAFKFVSESTVALEEELGIKVCPIPSDGNFQIRFEGDRTETSSTGGTVQIFNLNGQQVWEQQVPPQTKTLPMDLSHEPAGIYLIKVHMPEGIYSKKMILR